MYASIFTTSMCPAVAAGSLESIRQVKKNDEIRSSFFENVDLFIIGNVVEDEFFKMDF